MSKHSSSFWRPKEDQDALLKVILWSQNLIASVSLQIFTTMWHWNRNIAWYVMVEKRRNLWEPISFKHVVSVKGILDRFDPISSWGIAALGGHLIKAITQIKVDLVAPLQNGKALNGSNATWNSVQSLGGNDVISFHLKMSWLYSTGNIPGLMYQGEVFFLWTFISGMHVSPWVIKNSCTRWALLFEGWFTEFKAVLTRAGRTQVPFSQFSIPFSFVLRPVNLWAWPSLPGIHRMQDFLITQGGLVTLLELWNRARGLGQGCLRPSGWVDLGLHPRILSNSHPYCFKGICIPLWDKVCIFCLGLWHTPS